MITRRALLLGLALSVAASAACVAPPPRVAPGAVIAVGGGGTPDAVAARTLGLACGPAARILILPQASERPEAGAESAAFWRGHGARDVRVLEDLGDPGAAERIAAAGLIWFTGGDQGRLMAAIGEAGLAEAIRARRLAGAAVGGTSAGAAVLSGAMIVGGDTADLESVRAGGTLLADGLGLWEGVIVDQHFLERRRFQRLLAAVLDRTELVGVGIGERTAVVVHPDGRCEVLGEGSVMVVDARGARVAESSAGELRSADGVRIAIHRAGGSFRLRAPRDRARGSD